MFAQVDVGCSVSNRRSSDNTPAASASLIPVSDIRAINHLGSSSKGKSGRIIPLHKSITENLQLLLIEHKRYRSFDFNSSFIVRTERSPFTSSQSVVNMFQSWYRNLGLLGCSSHSGRRTFIIETSKKISLVGGSLRDIQMMVGHSSLQTTQRYIESDSESQRKVVNLI